MTMDFGDVVDEFDRRRTAASSSGAETTGSRYARDIRNQWAPWLRDEHDLSPWRAETGHVADYLRYLKRENYADSTINLRLSSVSLFYQELWKMYTEPGYGLPDAVGRWYELKDFDGIEDANPVSGIDRGDFGLQGTSTTKKSIGLEGRDEVPYLVPDEVQDLEDNVPAPRTRNVLIIRLLFTTGMRRTEIAELRLDGIDRGERIIDVPVVKSDTGRRVTYPASVDTLLTDWLDRGGRDAVPTSRDSQYLFPTQRRHHISPKRINSIVKESAEKAGLQEELIEYSDGRTLSKITTHTLRHSYGVQAVKSDIDIRTIQKLMGHADIETTEIYLKIADEDLLDRSRRFDPGFSL